MDAVTSLPREGFAALVGVFGLIVGSFLNVVIHRLPRDESLSWPGSHCVHCQTPIRWTDNLPLLSWALLRGRCRHCRAPISARYPLVEGLTGLLFAVMALRYGLSPMLPLWCAFAAALVATAFIDFDHQIIPDEISLGGLALALVFVPASSVLSGAPLAQAVGWSVSGALLGGGLFWLVGFLHARVSVALGREFEHWPGEGETIPTPRSADYWLWFPGVGFGDVKLLAMIGAVVGPFGVLHTILAASLAGLAIGLAWALATRRFSAPFGFAPAIAVGALLVALLPDALLPG
jgi:leader peptidase (prepilin peptidase)/N-methyltransferase